MREPFRVGHLAMQPTSHRKYTRLGGATRPKVGRAALWTYGVHSWKVRGQRSSQNPFCSSLTDLGRQKRAISDSRQLASYKNRLVFRNATVLPIYRVDRSIELPALLWFQPHLPVWCICGVMSVTSPDTTRNGSRMSLIHGAEAQL